MRNLQVLLGPLAGAAFAFLTFWLLFSAPARDPVLAAPLKFAAAALVVCMLLVAGWRFLQSFRLSRSPIHLMMLHVVGWMVVTQVIIVLSEVFRLSWWLYHGLMLLSVVTMLATFARQMRAGELAASLAELVDDDVGRRIAYGYRPEVRALVVATEARDPYTAGHMQRVAATSLALGKELGLPPEALRVLGQAGVVHDVGKLEVPDQVLNKHGPLTPEERALIEAHPVVGERIARTLGLNRQELEVIRHHHERWDGSGYPDRLAGEAIPLLARVTSVADVYDAMSSARAYRPAWSPEKVTALIEREAGVGFDPQVARAMLEMLARDRPSPPEAPAGAGPVADPAR